MESVNETPKLTQSNENSQNIEFNEQNWDCVTSQAFLESYIQYLMTIDEKKDGKNGPSTSSDTKRLKLDYQLKTIIKTNDWHKKLCKCLKCLKMYEDYNIEFLFGIKTIEWLPTEILFKIFTPLIPSDRRVASKSCKRFLEIWLCDVRLVFDKCVLDPEQEPLSIFLKSTRNYQHLVLGEVTMREESVFAEKFGETVTNIEFMRSNKNSSVLSQFSNLKTIKVENPWQLGDFSNVPTNLGLLVISGDDWSKGDALNMLKRYIDKTPDSFRLELTLSAKNILTFTEAQRKKIQSVLINLKANDGMFKLPRFDNLKHLELDYDDKCVYGTEEILDNLEEQCPALKDLSIRICNRLPHKNWKCLKNLTALEIPMEKLSKLRIFENSEQLVIKTKNKCFFVHETFLNKNLKQLAIIPCGKIQCITCFETMTKSFPNLETLTSRHEVTNKHLEALAKNTPKLKCFGPGTIDASVSFECLPNLTELTCTGLSVAQKTIDTWPLMQHLRILAIRFQRFDFETVTMFEKMSALEELRLSCDDIDDNQVSLFETMSKSLKRLEKFHFHCYKEPELKNDEIVAVMRENCKYLRHIDFFKADREKETLEKILQEYQSHVSFNLNVFNFNGIPHGILFRSN